MDGRQEHLAGVAAIAARLVEALGDGETDYAIALATELETQLTTMLERVPGRS